MAGSSTRILRKETAEAYYRLATGNLVSFEVTQRPGIEEQHSCSQGQNTWDYLGCSEHMSCLQATFLDPPHKVVGWGMTHRSH